MEIRNFHFVRRLRCQSAVNQCSTNLFILYGRPPSGHHLKFEANPYNFAPSGPGAYLYPKKSVTQFLEILRGGGRNFDRITLGPQAA